MSGGRKQRLAITRAVLKKPKIHVFNEATTGLDVATAERFAQTINKVKPAATIVFVAHQVPRGLAVDHMVALSDDRLTTIRVVEN